MERVCYSIESHWSQEHGQELKLAVMMVKPEGQPVGLLQLIHGMCDHKEKYLPLMEHLAGRGYASIIHDQRGHGESVLSLDDLGYFYTHDADALIADIRQVAVELRAVYPDVPMFLLGHSMGSLEARIYARKYDRELKGLFICGCPAENPGAKAAELMSISMALVKGERYRSRLLTDLAFSGYRKRFPDEPDMAWISSSPERVAEYVADPLCSFIFTLNGYRMLFKLMQMAYDVRDWKTERPDMPIHFISGANDPCMMDHDHFVAAIDKMHAAGYRRVNGRRYGGLRHEILLEDCAQEIYEDIADRMDEWRKEEQEL